MDGRVCREGAHLLTDGAGRDGGSGGDVGCLFVSGCLSFGVVLVSGAIDAVYLRLRLLLLPAHALRRSLLLLLLIVSSDRVPFLALVASMFMVLSLPLLSPSTSCCPYLVVAQYLRSVLTMEISPLACPTPPPPPFSFTSFSNRTSSPYIGSQAGGASDCVGGIPALRPWARALVQRRDEVPPDAQVFHGHGAEGGPRERTRCVHVDVFRLFGPPELDIPLHTIAVSIYVVHPTVATTACSYVALPVTVSSVSGSCHLPTNARRR